MRSATRRSNNNSNKISLILFVLFAATLIFSIIMAISVKSKNNKISDLNKTIKATVSENDVLTTTVSEQAIRINDLNANLSFFATPEEDAESAEAVIAPDVTTDTTQDPAHPNLYAASKSTLDSTNKKIAYLTFDDGPSNLTPIVLDILDQYNAKATFFVIGTTNEEYQQYYNSIVERGHTLALHSYTHTYEKIYASVDAFLNDYQQLFDLVYEKTGQVPSLMRYPGGSKNAYNKSVRDALITEMENRGFIYYDWNVSCGDGSAAATKESIYQKVIDECAGYKRPVILMHDGQGHQATVDALPDILQTLTNQGYSFDVLTPDMTPVQFPR